MKAFMLLAAALWFPQEKNEAEELFKKMEAKVSKAKTVLVKLAGTLEPQNVEMTGELALDEGNRSRCHVEGKKGQEAESAGVISDGKSVQLLKDGKPMNRPFDTPESLGRLMRISVARAGFLGTMDASQGETKAKMAPETAFVASDFKLGAKEKVGERESQAVAYKLARKGDQDAAITVWIDLETHLPLKRTMKKGPRGLTEAYSEFTLDGKIDPAKFELPK